MQNIIWAGLFAYCLPINEVARTVAVGFIAAQLILSYWTSGIAKLLSRVWRRGSAIYLIMRMASYCSPGIAQICRKRVVSAVFSWLTICFEVLSPFLLLGGKAGALSLIVLGTLFHVGIAVTMGLTTFVFAFIATFPILPFLAGRFSVAERRSSVRGTLRARRADPACVETSRATRISLSASTFRSTPRPVRANHLSSAAMRFECCVKGSVGLAN